MTQQTKPIAQLNDNTSVAIPTMKELVEETELSLKQNALMVLLNQDPPKQWIKEHPFATVKNQATGKYEPLKYLPIDRVKYLLYRIYGNWKDEIIDSKLMANSPVVTVRLTVKNPVTGEMESHDGIGAAPIQTDSGAGAADFMKMKTNGVQISVGAASSYGLKNAAEKFGKIFGGGLNGEYISYDNLLKGEHVTLDDLKELYAEKKEAWLDGEMPDVSTLANIDRVINTEEKKSYTKIHKLLQSL